MNNSWMVVVEYTDEKLPWSLYFLRADSDVEAIRKTLDSNEWSPKGTIKAIRPEKLIVIEIDERS